MAEADKIIKFIQATFKQQGFTKGIVAVSGGIDSAVSLMLTAKALGKDKVYSLQLPYKKHQSLALSDLVIQTAGIPKDQRLIINIGRPADRLAVKLNAKKDKVAKQLGAPETVIKAAPTAGLWPGQTDEKELGMSYAEIKDRLKQGKIKPGFKVNTPYHL